MKWIKDGEGLWHVFRTIGISPAGHGSAWLTECNKNIEQAVGGVPRIQLPDGASKCTSCTK